MSRPTQLNVVLLEGNLTADPEIRSTANGNRVVNLRVANTIVIPRGDRGDQEISTFLSAEGWNEIADAVDGLTKGTFVRIEGQLRGSRKGSGFPGACWNPFDLAPGYRAPVQQSGGQRYPGQQSPLESGPWVEQSGQSGQVPGRPSPAGSEVRRWGLAVLPQLIAWKDAIGEGERNG